MIGVHWNGVRRFGIVPGAVMFLMALGCASSDAVLPHNFMTELFKAASPIDNALGLAVWLEDQCESRESDDTTVTMLEALHDGLVVPVEALFAIGAVVVVGTAWRLYDRLMLPAGEPLPNRPEMVLNSVGPSRAAPRRPSGGQDREQSIVWSACVVAFDK